MKALRYAIPVAFIVLAVVLWQGLWRDPRKIKSVLIDKPVPVFALSVLGSPEKKFSPADYKGKVWLMNVWGSWCSSCVAEHPALLAFSKTNQVPLVGFNWKDRPEAASAWLAKYGGDPYTLSVQDLDGRVAIEFGVYGAPETFIIDREGVIRYKYIGPMDEQILKDEIMPVVKKLGGAG